MSARVGLRPVLPADVPALLTIFAAAIEELAADDYSSAQLEAWIAALDEETLGARLAGQLALVATLDGEVVGFATLADNRLIDLLYVHPEAARIGVATALVEALEKLARARGTDALVVDSSDTALPFFQRRGYVAERRNTVDLNGEWLGTTTMRKPLQPLSRQEPPR